MTLWISENSNELQLRYICFPLLLVIIVVYVSILLGYRMDSIDETQ